MGVDWLSCERCRDTFPDCGDFVSCGDECCKHWCSNECVGKDGYTLAYCKLGLDISSEGFLEDDPDKCPKYCGKEEDYMDCDDCEHYVPTSCKYCRHEDYEDKELLEFALKMLDMSRNDLIEAINCK